MFLGKMSNILFPNTRANPMGKQAKDAKFLKQDSTRVLKICEVENIYLHAAVYVS